MNNNEELIITLIKAKDLITRLEKERDQVIQSLNRMTEVVKYLINDVNK